MYRLLLTLCVLLSACALPAPPPAPVERLFDDAAFAAPSVRIDAADPLLMSPAMRQYLQRRIRPQLRSAGLHQGLIDALYTRGELQLVYDTELTRSAAEAFDARAGNCLSLVLMTAAFARELGLKVRFQSVPNVDTWGREGDLWLAMGHVNVALGQAPYGARPTDVGSDWLTVDFLPSADLHRQRAVEIDEARVVAMYMNNKAAEALARGRVDDAYAWARAGIVRDPGFASTYNTLGVVYLRHGRPARAEAALRHGLALAPDNAHALSNLVQALARQGRADEARTVAQRLKAVETAAPIGYFERGQQAMREGNPALARTLFEQAVRRGGDFHEFHFALAQALVGVGDYERATRQLELARRHSGTPKLQAMYAGKLQRLREQLVH
jgi:tetratricopeptide (TPR) repeat protein